jgi:uncharacterized membrane protein
VVKTKLSTPQIKGGFILQRLHHDGIVEAIRDAEQKTTGVIHISISPRRVDDAVAAAQSEFLRLGLNQSKEHNGVLIFVAPRSRKFAVIGGEAVHAKCRDQLIHLKPDV